MKARPIADFEQLMQTRYGPGSTRPRRFASNIEDLLDTYYGPAPGSGRPDRPTKRSLARSLQIDDGSEALVQPRSARWPVGMAQSLANGDAAMAAAPQGVSADEERARQERLLDLCAGPPSVAPNEPPRPQMPATAPAASPAPPSAAAAPAAETPALQSAAGSAQHLAPEASAPAAGPAPAKKPAKETEDEFLEDMKAILSGQKMYDPVSKSMTDRHGISAPLEARDDPPPPPPSQPTPQAGSGHDIFERIAQSMEYAGAYDLGPVELDNRFASFDEAAEKRRPKAAGSEPPAAPRFSPAPISAPPAAKQPDRLGEFNADLQDMLARPAVPEPPPSPEHYLREAAGGTNEPAERGVPLLATESSRLPDYAEPLYDTGEHVLAGANLYPDQLMVGPPPGVAFSYGDIIAMADLFADVKDMMAASLSELTRLKEKIRAGAAHYRAQAGVRPPNPGSEDWTKIISERYLRLAEDNYNHFAPNLLFKDPAFAKSPGLRGNHRSTWEHYHLEAMRAAQEMFLANPNQSYVPEWPLIINAFGDHFLTDAFASGHVFNKEVIAEAFKARFYSGGLLSPPAVQFLKELAKRAFKGDLAKRFSTLETYEPLQRWWNIVNWNPNINSASRFGDLLVEIAKAEPDTIANLAVKALHDRLNEEGLMVVNDAGAGPWRLFGDEHMSGETLPIMQAAVRQSVANILDPQIRTSNFNPDPYFARVWAYVPKLTAESEARVRDLAPLYVDPASEDLLAAATKILTEEVNQLIITLTDPNRKALKPA